MSVPWSESLLWPPEPCMVGPWTALQPHLLSPFPWSFHSGHSGLLAGSRPHQAHSLLGVLYSCSLHIGPCMAQPSAEMSSQQKVCPAIDCLTCSDGPSPWQPLPVVPSLLPCLAFVLKKFLSEFFSIFILFWSIVDSQRCVSFRLRQWVSYAYTYIFSSDSFPV